jgi:nucleotide-binding universal stress UspA family protein
MRVLLATDGSAGANVAVSLVEALRWPSDTSIEIVSVLDVHATHAIPFAPLPMDADPLEDALEAQLHETLQDSADRLRGRGFAVATSLRVGRPVPSILERAREMRADLIVCGSRGHGQLRSMMFGSVSAGLCDLASCPVLVARRPVMSRVLLAQDGSWPAMAAEQVVRQWPMFQDVTIEVASVVQVHAVWQDAFAMLTVGPGLQRYEEELHESRQQLMRAQRDSVHRLLRAGRHATPTLHEGDPAAAIVSTAEDTDTDLIVIGTHGRTGMERMVIGSVARAVLLHSPASVLLVRPTGARIERGRRMRSTRLAVAANPA